MSTTEVRPARVSGPALFARYAFPPNQLGYCGPADSAAFFSSARTGDDRGVRAVVGDFDGALPHLQLIADGAGAEDPLDPDVVEAYWLGSETLEQVRGDVVRPTVRAVFAGRCGPLFDGIDQALAAGALPHHSFTVLCVYPWVGMLGDERRIPQAMIVLDRCRIRTGVIRDLQSDRAVVESRPLRWDGSRLLLGEPVAETVRRSIDGVALSDPLSVGDRVALHWDWVCDTITDEQEEAVAYYTGRHLDLVNTCLVGLAERRSP